MNIWMDWGWMDEQMDRCMDGWTDIRWYGLKDGWMIDWIYC